MQSLTKCGRVPIQIWLRRGKWKGKIEIDEVWDDVNGIGPVAGVKRIWPIARVKGIGGGNVPVPVEGILPIDKYVWTLQL